MQDGIIIRTRWGLGARTRLVNKNIQTAGCTLAVVQGTSHASLAVRRQIFLTLKTDQVLQVKSSFRWRFYIKQLKERVCVFTCNVLSTIRSVIAHAHTKEAPT